MKRTLFLLFCLLLSANVQGQFIPAVPSDKPSDLATVEQSANSSANSPSVSSANSTPVAQKSENLPEKAVSNSAIGLKGFPLKRYASTVFTKWAKVKGEDNCRQAALDYIDLVVALSKDDLLPLEVKKPLDAQIKYRLKSLCVTLTAYNQQHQKARLAAEKAQSVALKNGNNGILAQQGNFANALNPENAQTSNYEKEGQELVELIQKTIRTQTWESNGGPGQIQYWGQQKVLVISQTLEAHEEISALLEMLRR